MISPVQMPQTSLQYAQAADPSSCNSYNPAPLAHTLCFVMRYFRLTVLSL